MLTCSVFVLTFYLNFGVNATTNPFSFYFLSIITNTNLIFNNSGQNDYEYDVRDANLAIHKTFNNINFSHFSAVAGARPLERPNLCRLCAAELHLIRTFIQTTNSNKFIRMRVNLVIQIQTVCPQVLVAFKRREKKIEKYKRCMHVDGHYNKRCEFSKVERTCHMPKIHVIITKVLKFISFGE